MSNAHGNADLEEIARQTTSIVTAGGYTAPSGARVDIGAATKAAVAGTRTFSVGELDALLDRKGTGGARPSVEVTLETTQQATRRLFADEQVRDLVLLNFASATRAGGGWLHGAKAQEEDLARCSALYACLQTQTEFYAYHRMQGSHLYSDRMIYSPGVPFFRVQSDGLLDQVYEAAVITAAAPNVTKLVAGETANLEALFRRRTGKVLALAEAQGHRNLVLGAWGCGVFANDPVMAADSFGTWLEGERFAGSFDRVVFAVYDPRPARPSYTPFAARLQRGIP